MSFLKKTNNSKTILASDITSGQLTLKVINASSFPVETPFLVTIWDKNTYPDPSDDSNMEIVKVTNVSGTTFTIVRNQESTGAFAHSSGDAVEMLFTAGHLIEIENSIPDELSDLSEDSTHRVVTDTEKSIWNGKQDALIEGTDYLNKTHLDENYLGINDKANDSNKLDGHDSSYFEPALGFTPEDSANKGVANGYPELDETGKVPIEQLPTNLMQYKGAWNAFTNGIGNDECINGTAFADGYHPSYPPDKAFDDNNTTIWYSTNNLPHWIGYDFGDGNEKVIIKIIIKLFLEVGHVMIKDFQLQGSNNGSDYTTVYTGQAEDTTDEQSFIFANEVSYRYYRIYVTSSWRGDQQYCGIHEISMYSQSSNMLVDGVGTIGDFYRVSVAGTQDLGSGDITFNVGDYVAYNGSIWEKLDGTDAVTSVAGRTGDVVVSKSDVGLGNVPNLDTTDAVANEHTHSNKSELDLISDGDHDVRTDNPHTVTKAQVGLGNVTNDAQIKKASSSTDDYLPKWKGTSGDELEDSSISESDVLDTISKAHAQNTDTGTASSTFQLDNDNSGVKIKNNSGVLEARNSADNDYANLHINNVIADGYASCKNFTDSYHYTGFPNRTDTSLSWDDETYTLTLTASSDEIWINGVVYSIDTLTKQLSIAQEQVSGLYWFWITAPGGIPQLNCSTTSPDIGSGGSNAGFDQCLVATVYWNTTTSLGVLSDERHWMGRDCWIHEYLHQTTGARYFNGLTGTFTDTTLTIGSGKFYDEDIEHDISEQTSAKVLYHDGDNDWAWDILTTPYKVVNPGIDNNLRYNNGTALATVSNQKYVNYWVFVSADITHPIHIILGSDQYNTISLVRLANPPSLVSLPSAEEKLIFQIIYQNNGGTPKYIETIDYRASSNLPITSYVATDHSSLSGLLEDDHPQYLLVDGSRNLSGNLSVDALVTIDGRDISVDGAKLDTIEENADVTDSDNVDSAGAVMESDYNANTILYAISDNTPVTLTVSEQTIVGRKTGGNIDALTATEVRALINVEDDSVALATVKADSDIASVISLKHNRLHDINDINDHNGVTGATENNLISFDANGLPKDSSLSYTDVNNAVSKKHTRQHTINSTDDHTSTITENNLIDADANGLPNDSGLAVSDVSSAISLKHTQNTDTQLDSGVVEVDGSDNVVILQNSVNPFQSIASNAVANTLVLKEGNVGIGTDSPSTLMHIQSATSSVLTIENTGNSSTKIILDANRGSAGASLGLIRAYWNGTETARIAFQSGADTVNKDDGDMRFYTRDDGDVSVQERMRISQEGNVGIGTNAPGARLEIEVPNNGNTKAFLIEQLDTTNNPVCAEINNDGTNHGIYIHQDGVLATSKYGLYLYSNAVQINSLLLYVHQANASSTQGCAVFYNNGSGVAVNINQNRAVDNFAFQVYSGVVQSNGPLMKVRQNHASSTSECVEIDNNGTGHGLYIHQDGNLASGKYGLYVWSNTVQTTTDYLVKFYNQNGSATNNAGVLYVHNNAKGIALDVKSEAGAGGCLRITNTAGAKGIEIVQNGVLSANTYAISVNSTVAQTNVGGYLLHLLSNHNSSINPVAFINNKGTGNALILHCDNNGGHLRFTGDPSPASSVDGDFWFDGTDFKCNIGGTVYKLDKTAV